MAQNGKRMDKNNARLRQTFEENSDEAWGQIKRFTKRTLIWILALSAVAIIVGAAYFVPILYPILSTVEAPELSPTETVNTEAPTQSDAEEPEPEDVFDESTTVRPLLSGARKDGWYTFLLFGTDKEGTNTDTIMVVSYDVTNQKLNLMSIPRDTMVNVGWDIKKINSVYGMRGINGFRKQIAKLIGFTPDYYVKIDLQAFVDVVDLIGGVEFNVPIPMHYHDPYQNLSIDLDPGLQTLNGEQAMGLVRFRKSDRGKGGAITGYDDTGRVQTQQAFLREMFNKCVKLTNWTKIKSYVEIFEKNVESDLTLGNMLWFARQAMSLSEDGFMTVTAPGNYYASAYSRSTGGMQSYVTLYGRQMVNLVNESFNPYLTKVSLSNMDIMGVRSDGSVYSSTGYVADSAAAQPVKKAEEKKPDTSKSTSKDETRDTSKDTGKDTGKDAGRDEEPIKDSEMPDNAEAPIDPTVTPPDATTDTEQPDTGETPTDTGETGAEGDGNSAETPVEPPAEPEPEKAGDAAPTVEPEPQPEPAPAPEPTADTSDTTPTESGDQ